MTDEVQETCLPSHREIVDFIAPDGRIHKRCIWLLKTKEKEQRVLDRLWLKGDLHIYEADSFFSDLHPWAVFFQTELKDYQWRPSEVQDFDQIVARNADREKPGKA